MVGGRINNTSLRCPLYTPPKSVEGRSVGRLHFEGDRSAREARRGTMMGMPLPLRRADVARGHQSTSAFRMKTRSATVGGRMVLFWAFWRSGVAMVVEQSVRGNKELKAGLREEAVDENGPFAAMWSCCFEPRGGGEFELGPNKSWAGEGIEVETAALSSCKAEAVARTAGRGSRPARRQRRPCLPGRGSAARGEPSAGSQLETEEEAESSPEVSCRGP